MDSTADLISGFVARRSTRNVNNCSLSCDSSFATRAFSVITGDLMMSQTVLIFQSPPGFPVLLPELSPSSRVLALPEPRSQSRALQLFLPPAAPLLPSWD